MKVYKILHKPSGLYYKPARSYQSQLSKNGKIYPELRFAKRALGMISEINIYKGYKKNGSTIFNKIMKCCPDRLKDSAYKDKKYLETEKEDFKIVEL